MGKVHQGQGRVRELDKITKSFFFFNIPEGSSNSDLFKVFAHFGWVGEVYIPKKVDKWGKKFGFVKFKEVDDVEELEGRLQEVWVGEVRLKMNIARFGHEASKQTALEAHRHREVKEALVVPSRSFKEVAHGSSSKHGGVGGNFGDGGEGVMKELYRSFVGYMCVLTKAKKVHLWLFMEGWKSLKLASMGDNMVLITSKVEGR